MIDTLYIESAIADHPKVRELTARYTQANIVNCKHYGEVFNPSSQNFRLQKNNPALILARKLNKHVLPAPDGYGIGGKHNYYFSHMLNCPYDCRYCFLQGMYRSAHYVLFINYDDYVDAIDKVLQQHKDEICWFFSGYDCDSMAFEPISRFLDYFLPIFAVRPNAHLEIRSKSTQIRALLDQEPLNNVVIAFSFSPTSVANKLEHGVPSVQKRIAAIEKLQDKGWKIGLRFDPLIYFNGYQQAYRDLFDQVFASVQLPLLHSVSTGAFRLPKNFFDKITSLYPTERLLAGPLSNNSGMVSYESTYEKEITDYCNTELAKFIPDEKMFPCQY